MSALTAVFILIIFVMMLTSDMECDFDYIYTPEPPIIINREEYERDTNRLMLVIAIMGIISLSLWAWWLI